MRSKVFPAILSLALIICFGLITMAQEEDAGVVTRGTFLSSRKNKDEATNSNTNKSITRPTNQTNPNETKPAGNTHHGHRHNTGNQNNEEKPNSTPESPLGLGYTIFLRDAKGQAVRVDPNREFHSGEAIRIALEPNTDGYLYIFHTENEGKPEMIFPDARLHRGNNAISAHVPYEVPSSQDPEPSLRWFVFDEKPANERVFVVVTRQPLNSVPISEELVKYCVSHQNDCPWHPSEAVWGSVQTAANAKVNISQSNSAGQPETTEEHESITRGLGLPKEAPAPTVIRMNSSAETALLVTSIDLNHK